MTLVEIITLKPPYIDDVDHQLKVMHKILNGEHPSVYHPEISALGEVQQLVFDCIHFNPEERPDMQAVVKTLKQRLKFLVGDA